MSVETRISLEQWRALRAVVDEGSFARAATALHKSQSAISYAIAKLQEGLGVEVLALEGRRARLTEAGRVLHRRASALLEEAAALEEVAASLARGHEAELRLAVEIVFPMPLLLRTLCDFHAESPATRVELTESVLSGTEEALAGRTVDLAVTSHVPPGMLGDHLMRLRFLPVAAPDHPLHGLGRPLRREDLRRHRQVVVRDSGLDRRRSSGWLGAEQRLTVGHMTTSIEAIAAGLGFAWLPEEKIRARLDRDEVRVLPMREGAARYADLFLVFADRDHAGPGARRLADLLRERIAAECPDAAADTSPA